MLEDFSDVALKTVKTWLEENDDWVCNKIV
jgi:hypothetical protein